MRKRFRLAAEVLFLSAFVSTASAQVVPPIDPGQSTVPEPTELQLEVFINDTSTGLIAEVHRDAEGRLAIPADQLTNVGLIPADSATGPDGLVVLDRLPNVTYAYDEASQSIRFTADDAQRVTRTLSASGGAGKVQPQRGFGGLVNYTLFANLSSDPDRWLPSTYQGAAGFFDARLFSPMGTVTNAFIGRMGSDDDLPGFTRLDTRWSYSDPDTMITYSAGDVISSGLSWSRPVRLGGLQMARNFGLRPDLITMPMPNLSGSAALPSSVDVYLNNSRVFSDKVLGGPFQVDRLPVVSGPGTARVVVRDALGRETVQDVAFYSSPDLLAKGLADFSMEAGYTRNFYGTSSWDYDSRLMGSGSARYGITNNLTLEGHAEGGGKLMNGGVGAVFGLGNFGVGSLSGAASRYGDRSGFLAAASMQLEFRGWTLFARSQRTFGDYEDIASVTALPEIVKANGTLPYLWSARPPKAVDQLSASVPLTFDTSALNLTFARLEYADGSGSKVIGASYSRQLFGRSTGFITAYRDVENKGSSGIFAGISIPLDNNHSLSLGAQGGPEGATLSVDAVRPQGAAIGDYGWRLRDAEGAMPQRSAAVSYRTPWARIEAGAQQVAGQTQATAQAEGAIALMGGDVFFSNRIDDAFAVVDAGAPGVEVLHENRSIGTTGLSGKLLLPSLRSWEENAIGIDPTNLPLSAEVPKTRDKVVPAQGGGVLVDLRADTGETSALVILRDAQGEFVEAGATGRLEGATEPFIVGYDGQAYLKGLGAQNTIAIDRRDGSICSAQFPFTSKPGEQVVLNDVVCR